MQRLRTVTSLDVSAVAGHHAMPAALLFQDMYHIIFLFGKIYLSILPLTTERAYGSFNFDVKNVNSEGKLWIFLVLTSGKMFFKFVRKVCPYSVTGMTLLTVNIKTTGRSDHQDI